MRTYRYFYRDLPADMGEGDPAHASVIACRLVREYLKGVPSRRPPSDWVGGFCV